MHFSDRRNTCVKKAATLAANTQVFFKVANQGPSATVVASIEKLRTMNSSSTLCELYQYLQFLANTNSGKKKKKKELFEVFLLTDH